MIRTLKFTQLEKRQLDRAARICRWQKRESALFARQILLEQVRLILPSKRRRR